MNRSAAILFQVDISGPLITADLKNSVIPTFILTMQINVVNTNFLQIAHFTMQLIHQDSHQVVCGMMQLNRTLFATVGYLLINQFVVV